MNCQRRISLLNLLMFAAACGTLGCFEKPASNSKPDQPAIRSQPPPHHDGTEIPIPPGETEASVAPTNPAAAVESGKLTDADLARSSWENPFRPRLWSCEGWRIDEDSMTSETESTSSATFLRPYRNVVIECRLSRPTESATSPATESSAPFELRLLDQSTGNWIGLIVATDSVSLSEFSADQQPDLQTLRKTPREAGNESQEIAVRLTMTPNRILVAIDARLKINAARPSASMIAECLVQFVAHEAGVTLSDLRIEGD